MRTTSSSARRAPTCTLAIALALASAAACAAPGAERNASAASALVIQEQGSFAVGGTVLSTPGTYNNNAPTAEEQTFHGDHLYAFLSDTAECQRAANCDAARRLPVRA